MFRVNSRIHHQAPGAPQFERQSSEVRVGILIQSDFFRRQLAVKPPPFGVSRVTKTEFAELRNAGEFLRDRDLHVMARNAFVMRERFQRSEEGSEEKEGR